MSGKIARDNQGFTAAGAVVGETGVKSLRLDDETWDGLRVANLVWNVATLEWQRMVQPMIEVSGDVIANFDDVETLLTALGTKLDTIAGHVDEIEAKLTSLETSVNGSKYGASINTYSTGKLIYSARNEDQAAATSDTDWLIKKFTWSGEDLIMIEELTGSVDNQASLSWRA